MPIEVKCNRPKMYRFQPGEAEVALRMAEKCIAQPYAFSENNRGFLEVVRNHLAVGSPLTIPQAVRLYDLYQRVK